MRQSLILVSWVDPQKAYSLQRPKARFSIVADTAIRYDYDCDVCPGKPTEIFMDIFGLSIQGNLFIDGKLRRD
jgi:hypothetical protein